MSVLLQPSDRAMMVNRRSLLRSMGGGAMMAALPALPARAASEKAVETVAILGAGMAGLAAAHALEERGVRVTVLEAGRRVGGRNWTLRGGDEIDDIEGRTQKVSLDTGLYFNAGPARIPSHHTAILDLCRSYGVPLQVLVNASRSALIADGDGTLRIRQASNDLRGHLSALLDKALASGSFDQTLDAPTRKALGSFLTIHGDLAPDRAYRGSTRSGLARVSGLFGEKEQAVAPRTLDQLLANPHLSALLFDENILMQATMLAPVGGMDQLPKAIAATLRTPVIQQAEVREIRRTTNGVRILYRTANGTAAAVDADSAIITLPLPVLARIPNDFSTPVQQAISAIRYQDAVKVAFQSQPFWEDAQIYGGLSFVGGETSIIWYPSDRFQTSQAVLLAAYPARDVSAQYAKRPRDEQIALARAAVERLHPGHGGELTRPIVVNWRRIPHSLGPWLDWEQDGNSLDQFQLLSQADGPFLFAGSHLSQYSGHWQEGAILSGYRAADTIIPARAARSPTANQS